MILVPCPHCGPRNASEFRYMGEEQPRPVPTTTTQSEWRAYLYVKKNPAGWTTETWFHALGCRAFFVAERNTVTNEFRAAAHQDPARPEEPHDS
jgi:heterotetrameric sarcosine oxidase delta subunit